MPPESCVIILSGPSMMAVVEEAFEGRTVICVNAAAPFRNFRCDWWVKDNVIEKGDRDAFPGSMRVAGIRSEMERHALPGISLQDLRRHVGCEFGRDVVAVDALFLAKYLGFEAADMYGADWSNFTSISPMARVPRPFDRVDRMRREAEAMYEESRRLGIRVHRVGAENRVVKHRRLRWEWRGQLGPNFGNKTIADRRRMIARLTSEIDQLEKYGDWLARLGAIGVRTPDACADTATKGADTIVLTEAEFTAAEPAFTKAVNDLAPLLKITNVEQSERFALPGEI